MARASASALGILRTQIGASVQFSRIVRWGNRLNDWNTIPTSRRMVSSARRSSVSSVPSTTMRPSWCTSSRLMQRIMVDLPEPDGPHTTTRSFSAMVSDTSRSTCIAPYHLLTLSSTMAGGALASAKWGRLWAAWLITKFLSAAVGAGELSLQSAAVFRHGETEDEVDQCEREIDLGWEA